MSRHLISLLQLCDPSLPIGGYAHSAGLETYVQAGLVKDAATARAFIREMLAVNLHYTDAALVALSYMAAKAGDTKALRDWDHLCEAVKLPKESRLASIRLGTRLLKIFRGLGLPMPPTAGSPRHHSVVFGYCAATLDIGLWEAMTGYYYQAAAGMVTNSVKLIPIGQQEGQELLFGLQSLIEELAEKSCRPDPDLIGICCAGFDIRCMQHERLYSRLYMS